MYSQYCKLRSFPNREDLVEQLSPVIHYEMLSVYIFDYLKEQGHGKTNLAIFPESIEGISESDMVILKNQLKLRGLINIDSRDKKYHFISKEKHIRKRLNGVDSDLAERVLSFYQNNIAEIHMQYESSHWTYLQSSRHREMLRQPTMYPPVMEEATVTPSQQALEEEESAISLPEKGEQEVESITRMKTRSASVMRHEYTVITDVPAPVFEGTFSEVAASPLNSVSPAIPFENLKISELLADIKNSQAARDVIQQYHHTKARVLYDFLAKYPIQIVEAKGEAFSSYPKLRAYLNDIDGNTWDTIQNNEAYHCTVVEARKRSGKKRKRLNTTSRFELLTVAELLEGIKDESSSAAFNRRYGYQVTTSLLRLYLKELPIDIAEAKQVDPDANRFAAENPFNNFRSLHAFLNGLSKKTWREIQNNPRYQITVHDSRSQEKTVQRNDHLLSKKQSGLLSRKRQKLSKETTKQSVVPLRSTLAPSAKGFAGTPKPILFRTLPMIELLTCIREHSSGSVVSFKYHHTDKSAIYNFLKTNLLTIGEGEVARVFNSYPTLHHYLAGLSDAEWEVITANPHYAKTVDLNVKIARAEKKLAQLRVTYSQDEQCSNRVKPGLSKTTIPALLSAESVQEKPNSQADIETESDEEFDSQAEIETDTDMDEQEERGRVAISIAVLNGRFKMGMFGSTQPTQSVSKAALNGSKEVVSKRT